VDEIVDLRSPDQIDAAVVTVDVAGDLDAEVVIELPDALSGTGPAGVRVKGQSASVPVKSLDDVLRLLDDYCPGPNPRT